MGSTSSAHNDAGTPRSEAADHRPSLNPAIISGACAVLVALITGVFNWINRPSQSPPASPPTLTINRPVREPEPVQTASLEAPPVRPRTSAAEPQYGLNFAAFQSAMKDRTASDEVRRGVVDRVVGKIVIWEGVVKEVVHPDKNMTDWEVTVCLVENESILGQSLFEHPAFCRFTTDPQHKAARLKRGDRVTISGECASHNVIGTEVRNAHLADVYYENTPQRR